ncbi:hypothetical protein GCM10028772_09510 [Nocardioides ultimimeridianus]
MLWALLPVAGAVVGSVVTVALLRLRTTRAAARADELVESGDLRWWSQVRERRTGGGWGLSGELRLGADGRLELVPDPASQRRGAQPETWSIDATELSFGPRRRDISGVSYATLTVRSRQTGRTRQFGCVSQRGRLPITDEPGERRSPN